MTTIVVYLISLSFFEQHSIRETSGSFWRSVVFGSFLSQQFVYVFYIYTRLYVSSVYLVRTVL